MSKSSEGERGGWRHVGQIYISSEQVDNSDPELLTRRRVDSALLAGLLANLHFLPPLGQHHSVEWYLLPHAGAKDEHAA